MKYKKNRIHFSLEVFDIVWENFVLNLYKNILSNAYDKVFLVSQIKCISWNSLIMYFTLFLWIMMTLADSWFTCECIEIFYLNKKFLKNKIWNDNSKFSSIISTLINFRRNLCWKNNKKLDELEIYFWLKNSPSVISNSHLLYS